MTKIKAIIVDDELAARNVLENLLLLSFPQIEVVAKAANLTQAVTAIKENHPDVVFLDVEMPKYAGYQIVKFFDTIDFRIVFVTAYDHYAIKAFEMNALDYLMKPIERSRLKTVIEKVEQQMKTEKLMTNYYQLLEQLETDDQRSLVIAEATKKQIVQFSNIIGIKAEGAYSTIHLRDGNKPTFSKNIGYFEDLLQHEDRFYRCHKSWLINVKEVDSYSVGSMKIEMTNGLIVKLSRFKKAAFQRLLQEQ